MIRQSLPIPTIDQVRHMRAQILNQRLQYQQGERFSIPADSLLSSHVRIPSVVPELELGEGPKDDALNAQTIFEFVGRLDRSSASDPRLWARLCHFEFAPYAAARWHRFPDDDKKFTSHVASHWFLRSAGLSGLRRNAIARLWWAAELATSGGSNLDVISDVLKESPYAYVTVLFGNQDVYQGLMERFLGTETRLRFGILETLRRTSSPTSDEITQFFKIVNLLARYRSLSSLPMGTLVDTLTNGFPRGRGV